MQFVTIFVCWPQSLIIKAALTKTRLASVANLQRHLERASVANLQATEEWRELISLTHNSHAHFHALASANYARLATQRANIASQRSLTYSFSSGDGAHRKSSSWFKRALHIFKRIVCHPPTRNTGNCWIVDRSGAPNFLALTIRSWNKKKTKH